MADVYRFALTVQAVLRHRVFCTVSQSRWFRDYGRLCMQ